MATSGGADMDKDAIRAAMEEAGLIRPKVMLFRLRDGRRRFDLYAGRPDARRIEYVPAEAGQPTTATAADVEAALLALAPLE